MTFLESYRQTVLQTFLERFVALFAGNSLKMSILFDVIISKNTYNTYFHQPIPTDIFEELLDIILYTFPEFIIHNNNIFKELQRNNTANFFRFHIIITQYRLPESCYGRGSKVSNYRNHNQNHFCLRFVFTIFI